MVIITQPVSIIKIITDWPHDTFSRYAQNMFLAFIHRLATQSTLLVVPITRQKKFMMVLMNAHITHINFQVGTNKLYYTGK